MQTVPGKKIHQMSKDEAGSEPVSHVTTFPPGRGDVPLRFPSVWFSVTTRVCRFGCTELQITKPLNTLMLLRII